jgi:hypothetical protein
LATKKLDSWWSSAGLLAVGLGTATIGWRFSERFFSSEREPALAEACSSAAYGFGFRFAAAAMAASFAVLSSEPAKRVFPIQETLMGGDAQVLSAPAALASVNAGA